MVGKDKRLARETTSMNERKAGRKIGILLFVLVLVLSTVSVIPSIADQGQSTFSLNGLTVGESLGLVLLVKPFGRITVAMAMKPWKYTYM